MTAQDNTHLATNVITTVPKLLICLYLIYKIEKLAFWLALIRIIQSETELSPPPRFSYVNI